MAAENGHLDVVSLLVTEGAGINKLVFESLLTPLHLALSKVPRMLLGLLCLGMSRVSESTFQKVPHSTHIGVSKMALKNPRNV